MKGNIMLAMTRGIDLGAVLLIRLSFDVKSVSENSMETLL